MKRLFVVVLVFLPVFHFYAQQNGKLLRLQDCYALAEENYPLSKKRDLIAKSSEFTIDNIAKGYYPRFDVFGQATYQLSLIHISEPTRLELESRFACYG